MKHISRAKRSLVALSAVLVLSAGCGRAPSAPAATDAPIVIETAQVTSHPLDITTPLPGELAPWEIVAIYPKVSGFVQWIGVDRGSRVRQGELMARLVAPELAAQRAEAQARLESAQSRCLEAAAKTSADQASYQRLTVAARTPGVISENELDIARQTAAADRARQQALEQGVDAARATLRSVEEIAGYLRITAPFTGVVTARNVHPGALVGPAGGSTALPMLSLSDVARLRLVVAVPEIAVATISSGADVAFTVAAYPGRTFHGKVARLAESVDARTRTMPVELDVDNRAALLSPGMYSQVLWPQRRSQPSLFVPASAIVRSMEETFVIRIVNGVTEWVRVQPGTASGEEAEVFGSLAPGNTIALRGTEELRPNTHVTTKPRS